MNEYIVAFLSLHSGELVQQKVSSYSIYGAMIQYLDISSEDYLNEEGVYQYCADCEAYINVYPL